MNPTRWNRGTMREPLLGLKTGDPVIFIQSTVKHRGPNMGATFWVMSTDGKILRQVSEYAYGRNVYKLVTPGEEIALAKQEDCTTRAKSLMANMVYAPKNVKTQTYFHLPKAPQRFKYVDASTSEE
jgi:hypothetical protein